MTILQHTMLCVLQYKLRLNKVTITLSSGANVSCVCPLPPRHAQALCPSHWVQPRAAVSLSRLRLLSQVDPGMGAVEAATHLLLSVAVCATWPILCFPSYPATLGYDGGKWPITRTEEIVSCLSSLLFYVEKHCPACLPQQLVLSGLWYLRWYRTIVTSSHWWLHSPPGHIYLTCTSGSLVSYGGCQQWLKFQVGSRIGLTQLK